jgi:hypothetical protein
MAAAARGWRGEPPEADQRRLAFVTVCCVSSSTTFHSTCIPGAQDRQQECFGGQPRFALKLASMRRPSSGSCMIRLCQCPGASKTTAGAGGSRAVKQVHYACRTRPRSRSEGTPHPRQFLAGFLKQRREQRRCRALLPVCQLLPSGHRLPGDGTSSRPAGLRCRSQCRPLGASPLFHEPNKQDCQLELQHSTVPRHRASLSACTAWSAGMPAWLSGRSIHALLQDAQARACRLRSQSPLSASASSAAAAAASSASRSMPPSRPSEPPPPSAGAAPAGASPVSAVPVKPRSASRARLPAACRERVWGE